MNKIFTSLVAVLVVFSSSCQNTEKIHLRAPQPLLGTVIGKSVLDNDVKDLASLLEAVSSKNSLRFKVKAKVKRVVNADGSWLELENGRGKEILVKTADAAMIFPSSLIGREIVLDGNARLETLNAQQLKQLVLAPSEQQKFSQEVVMIETTGLVVIEKRS
ncbi:hypothetical protein BCY91_01250 [Pelobium manganitolerans]|uniref:DUF4920 domain-containing protein n=1 Tax=Pelobium manganitolerans TaxID=1842495 RepID=A0A419SCB5_9SPHI|nr:DUF4920 domain-containing protein [Pelobium manganitolerans]RKD20276.1 hypothetical protein BCY91_01250 [Pelobium manganitolerans]